MIQTLTDDVYWIHECLTVDNRHIHSSSYLIEHDDNYLMIDTGDHHHRDAIMSQIDDVVGDAGIDAVFVSKSHIPHSANVATFKERWSEMDIIFAGGIPEVHGFPEITHWPHHGTEHLNGRTLSTLQGPVIDVDHTTWLFDHASGVLFSVDAFCHFHEPDMCSALSGSFPDGIPLSNISDFNQEMMVWMKYVDPELLNEAIDEVFEEFDVEIIAPVHGNPIVSQDIDPYLERYKASIRDIADEFVYPDA